MKPMVKTHSSIPQDDVIVHKSGVESNLDFCCPISFTYPNSFYHEPLDQSASLASSSHSLYSQVIDLDYDLVQRIHRT